MIHDGNRPARLSDPRSRDLSGGARSNHHQIIQFHFEPPAAPKAKLGPVATKGAMPGIAPACPMLAQSGHAATSDLSPLCEQKRTLQRPSFSVTLGTCLGSSCLLPQIEFFSDGIERKQS